MIANLQALRAFAAIAVMVFHFGLMPATKLPFVTGGFGVDLFFVLSGFIIAHSAASRPRHFLAHRLIRVLPSYWIITVIAALFALQGMDLPALVPWLGQSLFFLPGPGGRPALIFVAWTLVYELAFYLIYWVALRLGGRRAAMLCLPVLLVLAFMPLPAGAGTWPLLTEFAFGITVYLATERLSRRPAPPGKLGLGVAALGLALLLLPVSLTGYDPDDYQSLARVLFWGVPATAVVFGLVIAEQAGAAVTNRAVLLLGSASYAIYLIHPIVVGQLFQLPPQPAPLSWLYCTIATVATAGIAIAYYRIVEAPMLHWLRGRLSRKPPAERRVANPNVDCT